MKVFSLTLVAMVFTSTMLAQGDIIQLIQKRYHKTRSELQSYHPKSPNNFESPLDSDLNNSMEEEQLVAYESEQGVALIIADYLSGEGKSTAEFYYHENEVYLIVKRTEQYNAPISATDFDESQASSSEVRHYFDDGNMIRSVGTDGNVLLYDSSATQRLQLNLIREARKVFQVF